MNTSTEPCPIHGTAMLDQAGLCMPSCGFGWPEPDDVPFGMHETNLAPWEKPYALDATKDT